MEAKDFKPCAGMALSNLGGIEIMLNDSNDAVFYSWYGKVARRLQEIKYTGSGEPYFKVYSRRYYLRDFMRY